ncbi:glycosyltransferase family 39 protein [Candidatus Woesearchaeota archaeon]|nr:glycosyltransferase family 39 protein [Candidatus Woesearchaeota archaeon]
MYKLVWWDASVYIGMGKSIFSFGNAGLWESTRPIIWPIILGFFWKIGLNEVLVGRIIEIALGGLCILLTYKIAEKPFGRKTALLSALFLAVSPAFFFFNGIMLTEIVSTFFALLGLYLFINKRFLFSGMLLGLAFLSRFLQFLIFISLFAAVLFYFNKKNIRVLLKVIIGFVVVLVPYIIFNQVLYNDIMFPFTQHVTITKNSGWLNYQPLSYYFFEMFKENIFYLLSFLGVILAFKSKDSNKKIVASAFFIAFVFFNSLNQKEMRFLIILMPYMYILVSSSIVSVSEKFKNNFYKNMFAVLIVLSLMFSSYNTYLLYQQESAKQNPYAELEIRFTDANGVIWTSNPVIAASSSKKIELMYYPFFSVNKKNEIIGSIPNADFVFLDLCDLGCRHGDAGCEKEKDSLLWSLKKKLKTDYSSENDGCGQYVFRK